MLASNTYGLSVFMFCRSYVLFSPSASVEVWRKEKKWCKWRAQTVFRKQKHYEETFDRVSCLLSFFQIWNLLGDSKELPCHNICIYCHRSDKLIMEKIHPGYLSEMLLIFCINNFVQRLLTLYAIIILVFLLWRIFRNLLVTKH